ncbi:MAG: DsbA family protein [Pseudomonadota bacterium]
MNQSIPWRRTAALLLAAVLWLAAPPAAAVDDDAETLAAIRAELEALRKTQERTQAELAEIRKLLEGARPPREPEFAATAIELGGAPERGSRKAPLVLVEFSDYQCPFCRRHTQQVLPELLKNYVDAGKVRYVMKQFPLVSLHPQAELAARAALCAGDQGDYWEMHDALFAWSGELSPATLKQRAGELGMDAGDFAACVDGDRHAATVAADQALGQKLGVRGTPNFFVGRADPANPGQVILTQRIPGAVGYPVFTAALDALLAEGQKQQ